MAQWAMALANEMGYFPNKRQAADISGRAAYLYGVHFDGNPPRGDISENPIAMAVMQSTARQAVIDVMEDEAKKQKQRRPRGKK